MMPSYRNKSFLSAVTS